MSWVCTGRVRIHAGVYDCARCIPVCCRNVRFCARRMRSPHESLWRPRMRIVQPAMHPNERPRCSSSYSSDVEPEAHARDFLARRRFFGGDIGISMPPAAKSRGGTSRRAMAMASVPLLWLGFFLPASTGIARTRACRFRRSYFLRTLAGSASWCV